jgi:hypothetical protein
MFAMSALYAARERNKLQVKMRRIRLPFMLTTLKISAAPSTTLASEEFGNCKL